MKPEVVFVVPGSGQLWSSTFLRGVQLCEISRARLGNRYSFRLERMPVRRPLNITRIAQRLWANTRMPGSIYFITKQCVECLDPVAAKILQHRARAVLFDYVDTDMATVSMRGADVHLCASFAQYEYLAQRKGINLEGSVEFLLHGFDTRFEVASPHGGEKLTAVYIGASENVFIPKQLRSKVVMLEASTPQEMTAVFSQTGKYNFHYCVRPPTFSENRIVFKPFTKGFTAAVCGANVIVNREVHDAEALLDIDYPYFVDALDSAEIIEVFGSAEAGVGSPEWQRARKTMNELIEKSSPDAVADSFDRILIPLTH